MTKSTRARYTLEFKEEAVRLVTVNRLPRLGSWKFCVDDPGVCDPRILASSMPEHPAAQ
jgi:hypothetical protein